MIAMRSVMLALIALTVLLGGCSTVKPWDRDLLRDVYNTDVETVSFRDRALVILL